MNEVAAEILVKCGYADNYEYREPDMWIHYCKNMTQVFWRTVQFENDSLEGRRQCDAIEDWLWVYETSLWDKSFHKCDAQESFGSTHVWRLDRIKWCLSALEEQE